MSLFSDYEAIAKQLFDLRKNEADLRKTIQSWKPAKKASSATSNKEIKAAWESYYRLTHNIVGKNKDIRATLNEAWKVEKASGLKSLKDYKLLKAKMELKKKQDEVEALKQDDEAVLDEEEKNEDGSDNDVDVESDSGSDIEPDSDDED